MHKSEPRAALPVSRSRRRAIWVALTLALLTLLALSALLQQVAAARVGAAAAAVNDADAVTIHVVAHGWHSALIVPAAIVAPQQWPARTEFPDAEYFEVGWGDREYYQAAYPDLLRAFPGLMWPNPGVLQVVAFSGPPNHKFLGAPIATLRITRAGAQRLVEAIAASHERDAQGRFIAFGPSLYGEGRFYASVESFSLLVNCNVWVARRLRDAGVRIYPGLAPTVGMLFTQLAWVSSPVFGPRAAQP